MCGGLATRLQGSIDKNIPKSLLPINGQPFLKYQIDSLLAAGINQFHFATGHLSQKIQDYVSNKLSINASFSIENKPMGTAGALVASLPHLKTDYLLVLNGDTYFPINFTEFTNFAQSYPAKVCLATKNYNSTSDYGSITTDASGRVLSFSEKSATTYANKVINGGIYFFEISILQHIQEQMEKRKLTSLSLETDIFPELLDEGVYSYLSDAEFLDIGVPSRLKLAHEILGPSSNKK